MHPDSLMLMQGFRDKYAERIKGGRVLDVGSQNINGTYRDMFLALGCVYVGCDVAAGAGVDMVVTDPDRLPFADGEFDVVISGQTLEHAARPWILTKEMGRVLKPGGLACWIAPWNFMVHKGEDCPFDRWRILDDGMKILMKDAGLAVLDCQMYQDDTYGIGEKPKSEGDYL